MTRFIQTWLVWWRQRLLFRWRRDQLARDLDEELNFHFAQKQAENRRNGITSEASAQLARRQMGNITLAKEECRDMWSFLRWERVLQDLRHAIRMYGRTPVFTAICIFSIALGIGGNAAMFSLVNALLLRPLPYQQPDRLVRITGIYPRAAVPFFRERSRTMEIAEVSSGSEMNLTGQGQALRLVGSSASSSFLSVLGTSVALGRSFERGEESPNRDHVAIISHSLWTERFGGKTSAVGSVIRLDGIDREIVGIMPAGFSYPSSRVKLWIPLRLDESNFGEYWGGEFMALIGRLLPRAGFSEAQAEARALANEFNRLFPYPMPRDFNADTTAIPLQQDIVGDVRGRLLILLCCVAAVLLIACANVTSLLLSRGTTRRKELALRAALGAGRLRIVRQLLTETVGLAITAAVVGILLGAFALSVFKSVLPASIPGVEGAEIDWQIVAAMTALAVAAGLGAGLVPALSASQIEITETIKTGSQRSTSGFWSRVRGLIIAGETALTVVLLVSAGLLLRSVYELSNAHPGFDPAHILTVQISPNQSLCRQREACIALYDRLLQRAVSIYGVRDAAVSNSVPLDGRVPTVPVDVEGHPKTAEFPAPMLWLQAVTPAYFDIMRIPLLAGRYFMDADGPMAAGVLVIPASTAKRFWPKESAIGKHIKPAGADLWHTVVGVVGDVNHFTLSQALPAGVAGAVYIPYSQSFRKDGQIPAAMTLIAKVNSDSTRTARALEQMAMDQDPNVPVGRVQALDEVVSGTIADLRSTMLVFVSFAVTAIVLAAAGIYGLMSYWVNQRTYEIGLRLAVGCTRPRIISMILALGMKLTLCGVVSGIAGALLLTRFLTALLFGVASTDALTYVAVAALVLGVGVIATAVPAWRATRIDPVTALRAE